jgi:hypothetical protein
VRAAEALGMTHLLGAQIALNVGRVTPTPT